MSDLQQGIHVLKASRTGIPRQRVLFLDNLKVYWACPNSSLTKYIRIKDIIKISPLQQRVGMQIETRGKTHVFLVEKNSDNQELIDQIKVFQQQEVVQQEEPPLSPDDNQKNVVPSMVLTELNTPLVCSRELFSKGKPKQTVIQALTDILNKYIENIAHEAPLPKVNCPEDIPSRLEELLVRESGDMHEGFQEKLNFLHAKLSALETERERQNHQQIEIEQLREELMQHKAKSEDLVRNLEVVHQEKAKVSRQCRLYKSELDFSVEKLNKLEQQLQGFESEMGDLRKFEVLQRGIKGNVTVNNEQPKQWTITCSHDLKKIVLRELGMGIDKIEIRLQEIGEIIVGGRNQVQIMTNDLKYTISSSNDQAITILKDLFDHNKSQQPQTLDQQLSEKYRDMCNTIEGQLRLEERLIKRYKASLTESICDLNNNMNAKQSVYNAELESLKEISENIIPITLTQEASDYLNKERLELINDLQQKNRQIGEITNSLRNAHSQ